MKINVESGPSEIWMRIRFLEISGSPSLVPDIYVWSLDDVKTYSLFRKFAGHRIYK